MTENEAIKNINALNAVCMNKEFYDTDFYLALLLAVGALEKIQKYEAIGTIEEFKELKEKSVAKKVISFEYQNGHINYGCPICKRKIISKIDGEWCAGSFQEHCDKCGQKLDWQ